MDPSWLFRHFILVQACLVFFYLLWRLSAWWEGAVALRSGARRWVILGRVFLVASLTSPLLCAGLERLPVSARLFPQTPLAGRILGEVDGPGVTKAPAGESSPATRLADPAPSGADLRMVLVAVWAAGALAVVALRVFQWRRLGSFLAGAVPWRRRGRLEVLVHPQGVSPFAARIANRAVVVVPAFLVASGGWREAVRHELVHFRRGDTRWALTWDVLTALLWANPAIWRWRRRMVELQELACDEQVLEQGWVSPKAYGCTLLEVAEALSAHTAPRLAACTSMAEQRCAVRSFLSRRLDRILNHSRLGRFDMKRWMIWTLTGFCLWAGMAVAWAAGVGEAEPALPELRVQVRLQQLVSEALSAHLERCNAQRGMVVVMDPASGAVLARAGFHRDEAFRRMLADDSAPSTVPFLGGSTMKSLVVAEALESGTVSPSEPIDTGDGTVTVDGQVYREWKDGGLGKVTPSDVIVKSSNIGVILVAQRLGSERLASFLGRLGLRAGANASAVDLSLGGGAVPVTAEQLAHAYCVLVNGGREPGTGEAVVRPEVSEFIRKALVSAVEEGTGTNARCEGLVVGGKTGTSIREVEGKKTGTALFVGFAPAGDPRLVVSVIVDDVGSEVNGNRHAAPLFREIVEEGLPLLEDVPTPSH